MRYAIAGILLADVVVLIWAWRNLHGHGFLFMIFALGCVTFFGSLPVVLGVWTRRRDAGRRKACGPARVLKENPENEGGTPAHQVLDPPLS